MPRPSDKASSFKLYFPNGLITSYAQITGPRAERTISMALDTGASFTMIPREKILSAGYKIPDHSKILRIFTASGIEYVPMIKIASVSCFGVTVRNINILCHSLPSESPVEGLLGLNFLRHMPAFVEFFRRISGI